MLEYKKKYIPESFGLINTGVICYFNSLMQSLMSCTSLNESLLNKKGRGDVNGVIVEYIKLYSESKTTQIKSAVGVWKALQTAILQSGTIDVGRRIFASGGQQCADEALKLILEIMGDDVLEKFTVKYSSYIKCDDCGHKSDEKRDYNSFIKIIGNEIIYPQGGTSEEWQKLFAKYIFKHTGIVEDYKCDKCGVKSTRQKYHQLRRLSEVIVIVLSKYGTKRNIYYPRKLIFPAIGGGSLQYMLIAQIDHFGSMFGGHYIARCIRKKDDKLCAMYFNDTSVKEIHKDAFSPNPNSYILFYHLVN